MVSFLSKDTYPEGSVVNLKLHPVELSPEEHFDNILAFPLPEILTQESIVHSPLPQLKSFEDEELSTVK